MAAATAIASASAVAASTAASAVVAAESCGSFSSRSGSCFDLDFATWSSTCWARSTGGPAARLAARKGCCTGAGAKECLASQVASALVFVSNTTMAAIAAHTVAIRPVLGQATAVHLVAAMAAPFLLLSMFLVECFSHSNFYPQL